MAKRPESIKNEFEGASGVLDKYERKYLHCFTQDFTDRMASGVFTALKSRNIAVIEGTLKDLSRATTNGILLIGLCCLIIERERLYEGTEFGISYIRYAEHLFDELNLPVSTLSEAKIIVENYIDHYKPLTKAGFRLPRNATKLRYLPEALENHPEGEVYHRIVTDTFRRFKEWAGRKRIAPQRSEPQVVVAGDALYIEGKEILHFPDGIPEGIKGSIRADLSRTFGIRSGGNEPYIISTYGKGEQRAIERFLKKYRARK